MERSMKSFLDRIRAVFSGGVDQKSRKRPASHFDISAPSKISKLAPFTTTKTFLSERIIPIEREPEEFAWMPRNPFKKPQLNSRTKLSDDVVVLDEDNDERFNKFKIHNRSKPHSSTPNGDRSFSRSGDEDFYRFKSRKSPTLSFDKPLFTLGSGGNGTKPKMNSYRGSSVLDYSYRLDDKMKYKKLLESSSKDSSIYYSPTGKAFDFSSLNGTTKSGKSPSRASRESTKDAIIKVLDNYENDVVEVKDSDSDSSVVVINPPSPKPDIKVDPINSFRPIVDCSEATNADWLTKLVTKHKLYVEERQREVDNIRRCSQDIETFNREIDVELLRRKVNDQLQLRDVILPEIVVEEEPEFPELTSVHLQMVQRAFRGESSEVLAQKFNLNITRRDLMTLAGLNWLNDEVINFYMNLIIERGKNSKWPKTYCFNTFFYMKLIKDGPQSLRRWTKRVDIFSYDLICIPIHLGMHWCMAIIDFRDSSIRYYDSMGSPNNKCLDALRKYLVAEHMDKKNGSYDTSKFKLINMDNIPQQMNGSDCGMFSCTFAEFISRNAKITFKQEDMPYLRKKMVVEIVTGELLYQ